ncbi:Uncharacterised protein [Staphylococcus microti]|uniref:Uncharacterized protein n=1 Tax=Staphylococcus microti TaxID=569857 RepID=A0A380GQK2_9STAP|nr:hypothetical protein [Staphylococcus microti]SUM56682.1 Uncharacterised protein [Staphylococcus microti]
MEQRKFNRTDYLVPACLFIGIGLSFLFDHLTAGTCLGLGIRFLLKKDIHTTSIHIV